MHASIPRLPRRVTAAAVLILMLTGCAQTAGPAGSSAAPSLEQAAALLGARDTRSLFFSGSGRWYQFGQAPAPGQPWPPFAVSSYNADLAFDQSSARIQIVRKQLVEPPRQRPAPVEQSVEQFVRGTAAWNLNPVATPAAGSPALSTPVPQPAAVQERLAEIRATPQGFLRTALEVGAKAQPSSEGGATVSFTLPDRTRYLGHLNARGELDRVQTWIDNPVLGDTLVETRYADYRDFGGVRFPSHIVRVQGGHPVLDLKVSLVGRNGTGPDFTVPTVVAQAPAPSFAVAAEALAPGVSYLKGGTHHSVVVEQKDHLVVVEAPLNEARSIALLDHLKATYPGKPVRYLINTHAHFDHAGGLRTFVDAGATIVTHRDNQAYYQTAWAAPHALGPDRLSASKKAASFETFSGRHVLSDGQRSIEIHPIAGNGHNDAFALVYLPGEKVLIEADAYTPTAANVPPPTSPNPYSVNLLENIQKLGLEVQKIAALHGPRVTTPQDLKVAIGQASASN